jgi:hypothetical protein
MEENEAPATAFLSSSPVLRPPSTCQQKPGNGSRAPGETTWLCLSSTAADSHWGEICLPARAHILSHSVRT